MDLSTGPIQPSPITEKEYACETCGFTQLQKTNHYSNTYSFGNFSVCPVCPPFEKYPQYGGQTVWVCQEEKPKE